MSEQSLQPTSATRADNLRGWSRQRPLEPSTLFLRRITVGTVAALIVFYLGFRGAAYDAIVRQEAGIALWCVIAFGAVVGFLPRARLSRSTLAPVLALTALALLTLLSLAWTQSDERTYAEFSRLLIYLGAVVLPVLALNRHTWHAAAVGLTVGAVALCALALASRLAPATFPDHDIALAFETDRLSYPLDYWNAVAAWGAITAAMALAWSSNLRVGWARAASLATVPLATTVVYLTYSRAGVIGIFLAVIAVVALSRNRWTAVAHALVAGAATALVIAVIRDQPAIAEATGDDGAGLVGATVLLAMAACAGAAVATRSLKLDRARLSRRVARVAAPVGVGVALAAVLALAGGELSDSWDEFQNQRAVAVGDDPAVRLTSAGGTRREVWESGIDAFESEPLGGIGPGTFEYWWSENGEGQFLRDAHSLYVEELAELGILGFLCLVTALGLGIAVGARRRFAMRRSADVAAATALLAGVLVYLLHAGLDWMWEETAVTVLAFAALGTLLAAASDRAGKRHGPSRRSRAVLVGAALIAVVSQIPVLVSTARVRDSAAALAEQNLSEATTLAGEAVEAEPWAATPYASRASAAMQGGDLDAARTDIEAAIEREPGNWRFRLALGQIELAAGSRDAARAAFEQALVLSPASALPHDDPAAMLRDPAVRVSTGEGCLAYQYGACFQAARPEGPRCSQRGDAFAAVRDVGGVELTSFAVVKVPVLNSDPVFYVAGEVDGALTTWALDADAYRSGLGAVIPLNASALAATTIGSPVDPALFGLSASDRGVKAATNCLDR